MKIPRDLSGDDVVKGLKRAGYERVRQKGDHVQMMTQIHGKHQVTIPLHDPVKIGTLAAILDSVAAHLAISRQELLARMRV